MTKLNEALEYLKKYGWTKHTARNQSNQVCSVGAVWAVYGVFDKNEDIFSDKMHPDLSLLSEIALEQFPDRIISDEPSPIVEVNDNPLTTFDDVVMIFEKAIVKAEEME